MATIERRLDSLGIVLPEAPKPVANYVPVYARHSGSPAFVSGQIPMRDGSLIATGSVPEDVSIEVARECAAQCVVNALAAIRGEYGSLERLRGVARLRGYVASGPGFRDHSTVIDGASDLLAELLGESGSHSRVAVGVTSLPLGAPVEIEFVFVMD